MNNQNKEMKSKVIEKITEGKEEKQSLDKKNWHRGKNKRISTPFKKTDKQKVNEVSGYVLGNPKFHTHTHKKIELKCWHTHAMQESNVELLELH